MHNNFIQKLLLPFSWIYSMILQVRESLYKRGILESKPASLPTFCVGNVVLGGSGKTPFCQFLVKNLQELGQRPVILLRGYKGNEVGPKLVRPGNSLASVGDEALMHLDLKIPVVVSRRRSSGIDYIKSNQLGDCVVMDDGLQHLSLKPQHKFLLLDVSNDQAIAKWKFGRVLPAGFLREPLAAAVARAETIILVNKNNCNFSQEVFPAHAVFHFALKPNRIVELISGNVAAPQGGCDILCSIANPESFAQSVESLGLKIDRRFIFPDHHKISVEAWQKIELKNPLLITSKDAVKLRSLVKEQGKVFVLEQTGAICETQAEKFEKLLKEVLNEGNREERKVLCN